MLYCGACCLLRDNVQVPVFIKGANWVPADAFESRVSSAKLTRLLKSLQDANMNAVRNWGGGIYQRVREKFLVCIVQYALRMCVCVCVCVVCVAQATCGVVQWRSFPSFCLHWFRVTVHVPSTGRVLRHL